MICKYQKMVEVENLLLQALLLTQEWALRFAARENLLAPTPGTPLLRRENLGHSSALEAELPSPRFLGRSECPAMCSAPPGALFWANSSATCLAGFLGFLQRTVSCSEREGLCSQVGLCVAGCELSLHSTLHRPNSNSCSISTASTSSQGRPVILGSAVHVTSFSSSLPLPQGSRTVVQHQTKP